MDRSRSIQISGRPFPNTSDYPLQRLQIELVSRLHWHELHGRTLNRLGDRLPSQKSLFCPFESGRTYFGGISRASCPGALSLRLR